MIVDIKGRNLTLTERDSGIGIKYTLPENPTVGDKTLTYNHEGLIWTYDLIKTGLKLSAVVKSSKGKTTYTFPFTLLGTSGSLNNGRMETDEFVITRPVITDANGVDHVLNWTQDAGEIKFTFDDTGVALPYTIDPSTTFTPPAEADDGFIRHIDAFYPPTTCSSVDTTSSNVKTSKIRSGPNRNVFTSMLKWDTSSIPDSATITAADFKPYITLLQDADSRNWDGEYYSSSNWPINCADWIVNAGTTAFAEDLTNLTVDTRATITMSSPTSISKTGDTGLRMSISGGDPSGFNNVSFEDYLGNDAELVVTYIIDPTVSTYSPTQVGDGTTEAVTVTGTDFESNAQLIMQKSGESNIACTGESVNGPGTQLTATCDFTSVALGLWDAQVDNGSGHTDTLTSATEVVSSRITLIASGVTSGEHTLKITRDATQIQIHIDGILEATHAGTANVVNNANVWEMFGNGAMPYVEFVKITNENVLELHYEINTLPTFELVDRSGEGHDAAIRFPDTLAGLTVDLASTEATVFTDGASASNLEVIGAIPDIKNYTDAPDAGEGWWVFEVINIFTNGLLPYQAMTTIFSLAVIGTGVVFAAKFLRHALLVGLVMIALVAIMWLLGANPGWWLWLLAISPFPMFLMWKRMNP